MLRKRFQLLGRFIYFSDNQQSTESPDTFYKIHPLFNVALSEQDQMLLLGAKLVPTLFKTIKQPQLSDVCCDSYFTSFSLVQRLHTSFGVKCISTFGPNHIG